MAGWKLRKDKTQTETPGEENAPSTPLAEAPPENNVAPDENHDNPLSLHTAHWELPAEDWTSPTVPVEDEPVFAEEAQHESTPHESIPHEQMQPEETQYHAAPLDLGTSDVSHAAPRFDANEEDEEASEPAPHFESEAAPHFEEDETALEETDFSAIPSEPIEIAVSPPTPEPEVVAAPEPEVVAAPEPEVVAAPEPQVIAAPPSTPAAPLFPMPAPAQPEISTATLRMDRSELASAPPPATGISIPPVSPFLLDVPRAEAEEMPHTLLVRIGRLSATFEITKEVTVIGRPDTELSYYPDIEIELDDAVSRRHAEILRHEDDFYLVDAGSTNGTLLNGETLTPHEERLLAHGDRIRVGERTEIIFE